ncbi:2-amino-4-hydroxy-6-hydroxymethyldihydropteridine diphosphokinase [bacterium AH-315-K20]|nr:2-amino-4-hydroxy-6-hydroxymethyldihydropteridine diphosphokinase [bacterium AH-315-K20]
MDRVTAYIGIGTNLGDRRSHVNHAVEQLDALPDSRLAAVATVIETEPVGPISQGAYLNTVAALETGLAPVELLGCLHAIERQRGRDRQREERWGPRTLDLDILIFGDRVVQEPGLTIPHRRLAERAFVLVPLAEIAPELRVPGTGHTVTSMLDALYDRSTGMDTNAEGSA